MCETERRGTLRRRDERLTTHPTALSFILKSQSASLPACTARMHHSETGAIQIYLMISSGRTVRTDMRDKFVFHWAMKRRHC